MFFYIRYRYLDPTGIRGLYDHSLSKHETLWLEPYISAGKSEAPVQLPMMFMLPSSVLKYRSGQNLFDEGKSP